MREEFHAMNAEEVMQALESSPQGLSQAEAESRLKAFGPNELREKKRTTALSIFLRQFKSLFVKTRAGMLKETKIPENFLSLTKLVKTFRALLPWVSWLKNTKEKVPGKAFSKSSLNSLSMHSKKLN